MPLPMCSSTRRSRVRLIRVIVNDAEQLGDNFGPDIPEAPFTIEVGQASQPCSRTERTVAMQTGRYRAPFYPSNSGLCVRVVEQIGPSLGMRTTRSGLPVLRSAPPIGVVATTERSTRRGVPDS